MIAQNEGKILIVFLTLLLCPVSLHKYTCNMVLLWDKFDMSTTKSQYSSSLSRDTFLLNEESSAQAVVMIFQFKSPLTFTFFN